MGQDVWVSCPEMSLITCIKQTPVGWLGAED